MCAPVEDDPFEFQQDLWRQKTKLPWLLYGVVSVILHLPILIEHRLVTDGWTDR